MFVGDNIKSNKVSAHYLYTKHSSLARCANLLNQKLCAAAPPPLLSAGKPPYNRVAIKDSSFLLHKHML